MKGPLVVGALVRWISPGVSGTVLDIVEKDGRQVALVGIEVSARSLQVLDAPKAGAEDSRRRLVDAAPHLLVALRAARSFVESEATLLLDSSCRLHPETLEPDRDTAEPEDLADIEAVEAVLAGIDAALAKAGAQ